MSFLFVILPACCEHMTPCKSSSESSAAFPTPTIFPAAPGAHLAHQAAPRVHRWLTKPHPSGRAARGGVAARLNMGSIPCHPAVDKQPGDGSMFKHVEACDFYSLSACVGACLSSLEGCLEQESVTGAGSMYRASKESTTTTQQQQQQQHQQQQHCNIVTEPYDMCS